MRPAWFKDSAAGQSGSIMANLFWMGQSPKCPTRTRGDRRPDWSRKPKRFYFMTGADQQFFQRVHNNRVAAAEERLEGSCNYDFHRAAPPVILAGTPTAVTSAGRSRITTAPAPTVAHSPIEIFG